MLAIHSAPIVLSRKRELIEEFHQEAQNKETSRQNTVPVKKTRMTFGLQGTDAKGS